MEQRGVENIDRNRQLDRVVGFTGAGVEPWIEGGQLGHNTGYGQRRVTRGPGR